MSVCRFVVTVVTVDFAADFRMYSYSAPWEQVC